MHHYVMLVYIFVFIISVMHYCEMSDVFGLANNSTITIISYAKVCPSACIFLPGNSFFSLNPTRQ